MDKRDKMEKLPVASRRAFGGVLRKREGGGGEGKGDMMVGGVKCVCVCVWIEKSGV